MRKIKEKDIVAAVERLVQKVNFILPEDTCSALRAAMAKDTPAAKKVLKRYFENADIAAKEKLPICQDTGICVFFVEKGKDAYVEGDLTSAVNKGAASGYSKGLLRKSVVADPLFDRKNTGTNTPAVIHFTEVKGNKIKISFLPKGAGSENMSKLYMLPPSSGEQGVIECVLQTVLSAGANACPPMAVGVGIGGTFERAAMLSKKAMLRKLGQKNKDKRYAALEEKLFKEANKLNVGPQGFGGKSTVIGVMIEQEPCHMASLPVAVNIGCHAHRHGSVIL